MKQETTTHDTTTTRDKATSRTTFNRFIKDVNGAFSALELGHLFITIFGVSFGAYVATRATLLSECLFQSNWSGLKDKVLKKDLLFVLQQSQIFPSYSAYGLYDLNMTSYIRVLKLAFSAYTILSNVSAK
uniref:Uncharacterized protein LOC114335916 n=1 Tax=Diabrotica virgifera virgifera TaxID=50390 RepID=A0A6P7FZM8_DIAVI